MSTAKRSRKANKAEASTAPVKEVKDQTSPQSGSQKTGFPIVGIGASAGGLEAFTGLLKALSPDLGMAYVFVPHLDPTRESAFTQILARSTSMPVIQITDGLEVERNRLY